MVFLYLPQQLPPPPRLTAASPRCCSCNKAAMLQLQWRSPPPARPAQPARRAPLPPRRVLCACRANFTRPAHAPCSRVVRIIHARTSPEPSYSATFASYICHLYLYRSIETTYLYNFLYLYNFHLCLYLSIELTYRTYISV